MMKEGWTVGKEDGRKFGYKFMWTQELGILSFMQQALGDKWGGLNMGEIFTVNKVIWVIQIFLVSAQILLLL